MRERVRKLEKEESWNTEEHSDYQTRQKEKERKRRGMVLGGILDNEETPLKRRRLDSPASSEW